MANANAEFKLKLATTQLTVQEKERLEVIHDREWSSLALFTDFWLNCWLDAPSYKSIF